MYKQNIDLQKFYDQSPCFTYNLHFNVFLRKTWLVANSYGEKTLSFFYKVKQRLGAPG